MAVRNKIVTRIGQKDMVLLQQAWRAPHAMHSAVALFVDQERNTRG